MTAGSKTYRKDDSDHIDLDFDDCDDEDSDALKEAGFSVTLSWHTGACRRDGFALLRDVITEHRRRWTASYLEKYLRACWQSSMQTAGQRLHVLIQQKGKLPTLKQFAKFALPATQIWFGGDVALLYAALGQERKATVDARLISPHDIVKFTLLVYEALGGTPLQGSSFITSPEKAALPEEEAERITMLQNLVQVSLDYLQLSEALGRKPTLEELERSFDGPSEALSPDIDAAWRIFENAVSGALAATRAA